MKLCVLAQDVWIFSLVGILCPVTCENVDILDILSHKVSSLEPTQWSSIASSTELVTARCTPHAACAIDRLQYT